MNAREAAAADIAAMCGRRRNLTVNERLILYQLLDTPAIRARWPMFSLEELKAIADEATTAPAKRPRLRVRV